MRGIAILLLVIAFASACGLLTACWGDAVILFLLGAAVWVADDWINNE